jgi:hypothetical protein
MKLFLLLFLSIYLSQSFACEVITPEKFSISISPETGDFFFYGSSTQMPPNTKLEINNCSKASKEKKYLMMAFGPQNLEFTDRIGIYDFTNNYLNSGCFIKDALFKENRDYSTRKNDLTSKWHTIRSCIEVTLKENRKEKIEFPQDQPGCKVQVHSPSEVSFNGGICFFKPQRDSQYEVRFNVRNECRDYEDIKKLRLTQFDFQSMLNFYLAGDASGTSVDLNAIGSFPLRISISPENKIIPLSDDFGPNVPRFPSYLELPDLHLGAMDIETSIPGKILIRPTFWVDHSCPKKCIDHFCQSVCDYAQPLTGRVDLIKLDGDKELEIIDQWYDGAVSQPRFQGELKGSGKEIDENLLIPNTKYRLKINFSDPKADFEEFKELFFQKLGKLPLPPLRLGRGSIPEISRIQEIPDRGKIPAISTIPDLNFGYQFSEKFDENIRAFSNQFNYQAWPPYISKVCNNKICSTVSKKNYLTLALDFTFLGQNLQEREFIIQYDRLKRGSTLSDEYEIHKPVFPTIKCPF